LYCELWSDEGYAGNVRDDTTFYLIKNYIESQKPMKKESYQQMKIFDLEQFLYIQSNIATNPTCRAARQRKFDHPH
jgi:hypothetical protein